MNCSIKFLVLIFLFKFVIGTKLAFPKDMPVALLSTANFLKYVGTPPFYQTQAKSLPRTYGVFVLFNALNGSIVCPACMPTAKIYNDVTSEVSMSTREKRGVHFATINFTTDKDIFIHGQMTTVPTLLYLPPTVSEDGSLIDPERYKSLIRIMDIGSMSIDLLKGFICESSNLQENHFVKSNGKFISLICFTIATIIILTLINMRDGKIWSLIKQTSALENGIALASGMFIVVMTSGIMWCTIRKPPVMADQIFAAVNNIHSQYFMESYIILACNLASTIAILSLSDVLPRMNWSSHFKFFLTLLLLGMIVFGIRMEMALFKLKLPSYPFRILF